jgi:hypothetical protein
MDIPPKALRHHVERHRSLVRSFGPLALGLTSSTGDPLPVLTAFRDFLELERRKARRRSALLATLFAILFLVVLGGGLAFNFVYLQQMKGDFHDIQKQVMTFETVSQGLKKDAQGLLAGFEQRAGRMQTELDEKYRRFLDSRAELDTRSQTNDARLRQISESLLALDAQNRKLEKDLEELRARQSRPVAIARATPPDVSNAPSPAVAEAPGPEPSRSGPAMILVSIAAPGLQSPVTCRLPLPE